MRIHAKATLCATAMMLGAFAFSFAQPPADESARLRVLLVLDTDDPSIGESVAKDGQNLEAFFREAFAKKPERLELTKLSGKQFSRRAVIDYFVKMKPAPDETLLVYFSSHGATRPPLGHGFVTFDDAGKSALLFRSEVRALMQVKHPRLAILISDTCGNYLLPGEAQRDVAKPDWKVVEALFLKPRGVVDINSVTEGESAYSNSKTGGFFTLMLLNQLRRGYSELAGGPDGSVHWHDVIPAVQEKTQSLYGVVRQVRLSKLTPQFIDSLKSDLERKALHEERNLLDKQLYQTVRVFSLPSLWRFGARLLDNDGDGVKIAFLHAETPAALAGFKPGDIIKRVEGKAIQSLDQFFQAILTSGAEITVDVRRGKTAMQLKVKLPSKDSNSQDI